LSGAGHPKTELQILSHPGAFWRDEINFTNATRYSDPENETRMLSRSPPISGPGEAPAKSENQKKF